MTSKPEKPSSSNPTSSGENKPAKMHLVMGRPTGPSAEELDRLSAEIFNALQKRIKSIEAK